MNKPGTPVNERTKPVKIPNESTNSNEARRTRVVELLNAVAVLGAAVVLGAMSGPKVPKVLGD